MIILIDTNVMLDFLTKRVPYFENADRIIQLCKTEKISGYMAAHSVMNAFYILRKVYTSKQRRDMLNRYAKIVSVVGIDGSKIEAALMREDFEDFEDCLQDECAVACGAEYIVTRNVSDFKTSRIKAVTPDEFLKQC